MTDTFDTKKRSEIMRAVKGENTGPERRVRSALHRLGFRFRLHRRDLPGRPDLVFPRRRKVVFVHGCFWHGHEDPRCNRARTPKTRTDYWTAKVARNRDRDARALAALEELGWRALVVWECELRDIEAAAARIAAFLRA